MAERAVRTTLDEILPFRALFLQEMNCQIRYNACHERGWTDSYLLTMDDVPVGYGSIKGQQAATRDTVFEFYVVPSFRNRAMPLFRRLVAASGAVLVECQTNDRFLSTLAFDCSTDLRTEVALFADHTTTGHAMAGAVVRRKRADDRIFEHSAEPVGDYVLELQGEIAATGGFLLHYNPPFADLFMEVRPDRRGRGCGTYLVQELKQACYLAGRVPAARCGIRNTASRATLIKAGFRVSGFMLQGHLTQPG